MRWSLRRRTEPGMVRVNHKKLIDLQRGALRAKDLEIEIRETRAAVAEERAAALLLPCEIDDQVRDRLMVDLPLTTSGDLHEVAFLALRDALVWKQREQWLADELERKKA